MLPDYRAQRARFLQAAERAGAQLSHWLHPLTGPQGEALYTDVALLGNPAAEKMMLIVSGVHGVEGYYGSDNQIAWLEASQGQEMPSDCALLLVHLINPWGTAHLRRVNENNIDLNRNFIDFARPLPTTPAYPPVHGFYCGDRAAADTAYAAALQTQGWPAMKAVVEAGQYTHPDGIFFGGDTASWSRLTLAAITETHLQQAKTLISFDLHTGAGAYGHPMLLAIAERPWPALPQARNLFGEWLTVLLTGADRDSETGVTATATGYLSQFMHDSLPDCTLMQLVIECGTLPGEEMHRRVRDDHWLHLTGDPASEEGKRIKQALVAGFYPEDADWRAVTQLRTQQIFRRAWQYLTGGARQQG